MDFIVGHTYARTEISSVLGGEMMSYLPQRDGCIVCGCFVPTQGKDPKAPEEVLAGTGPVVESKAEMLRVQERAIPVFLERGTNRWEYRGEYVVDRCCNGRAFLQPTERRG